MLFTPRLLLTLSAAVALSACAASTTPINPVEITPGAASERPESLSIDQPFWIPGEQMTFELSLRGIVGGEAITVAGRPGKIEGQNVLIVRSRVESSGVAELFKEVSDDVTTWIDTGSGYPVYMRGDLKFGKKESFIETRFAEGRPGSFRLYYHRKGTSPRHLHQLMPPRETVFDGHSIMGALRAWRAEDGGMAYCYILSGKRLWRNLVRFTGREEIETSLGKVRAVRLDGVAARMTRHVTVDRRKKPRHYTVWFSDDDKRLPLKIEAKTEYGDVKVELVNYQSPTFTASR